MPLAASVPCHHSGRQEAFVRDGTDISLDVAVHGGFSDGLERWVARLACASNMREASLFPRDVHRLTP